jgi:hypothetical protein
LDLLQPGSVPRRQSGGARAGVDELGAQEAGAVTHDKEEDSMTTKTETPTAPHWAAELGRQVAERRAAHEAEAAAEAAARGQRAALPAAELARRFAEIAVRVVEACDAFGRAAAVDISSEPAVADLVQLRSGPDQLELRRQDDDLRATLRALSRGDQFLIALDGEPFDPEPAARRIAETFIAQLSLTHGGPHVHAQ